MTQIWCTWTRFFNIFCTFPYLDFGADIDQKTGKCFFFLIETRRKRWKGRMEGELALSLPRERRIREKSQRIWICARRRVDVIVKADWSYPSRGYALRANAPGHNNCYDNGKGIHMIGQCDQAISASEIYNIPRYWVAQSDKIYQMKKDENSKKISIQNLPCYFLFWK